MARTVVVTGANGLVGSRIVARLAQAGERVVAVGRGPRRFGVPSVEYVELDLLHPQELFGLMEKIGPQGIIHCAAATDVDACEKDPRGAWLLNVGAVEAVAQSSANLGARLTALSTDYVFDGEKGDYAEDDPPIPRGVYARTKRAGEEAALILAKDRAVCRVAVIYSGYKNAKRTFASAVADSLEAGKPVKAFTLALARKLGADEKLIEPTRLADLRLPAPRPLRCGLRVEKVQKLLGASVPLPLQAALDRFLQERRA